MPRVKTDDEIREFRAALCAVAERLFAKHGYEGVTLRALAGELGCSPMTPYRYFENKEAIFAAVRTAAFVRFGEAIEKAAAEPAEPIARIRNMGRAFVAFAMREQSAYRIMFEIARPAGLDADALADPEQRGSLLRGWVPLIEAMEELVERGIVAGDPLELAHLAFVTLHGLVTLELAGKFLLGRSFDEMVEPALEHVLRGIGAPPTAASVERGAPCPAPPS